MDPLVSLVAASLAFAGTHFVLSHPLRRPLVQRLGPPGFQALYSLLALATLGWMVWAFRAAGPGAEPLWNGSGEEMWAIATALMLPASVLLAGSFARNPALPDPKAQAHAALPVHGVFHVTRHPMMWSFALWAAAHVLVSPTPRQIVLAGAVALLALLGAHLQDRKKAALMGDAWAGWAARTSYWPRLAGFARAGAAPWLVGAALWLALTWAHLPAAGIPAGVWRWLG